MVLDHGIVSESIRLSIYQSNTPVKAIKRKRNKGDNCETSSKPYRPFSKNFREGNVIEKRGVRYFKDIIGGGRGLFWVRIYRGGSLVFSLRTVTLIEDFSVLFYAYLEGRREGAGEGV